MSFLKILIATVVISFAVASPQAGAWEGVVMLYEKTHFNGQSYPWFIDTAQKCYELTCFNDKVTSAQWKGLPQKGAFNGKAHIAFYKEAGCKGHHLEWTTEEKNFPMDFAADKMNDGTSSFMIWVENDKLKNGIESPCK